jgi:hypothetical protein
LSVEYESKDGGACQDLFGMLARRLVGASSGVGSRRGTVQVTGPTWEIVRQGIALELKTEGDCPYKKRKMRIASRERAGVAEALKRKRSIL